MLNFKTRSYFPSFPKFSFTINFCSCSPEAHYFIMHCAPHSMKNFSPASDARVRAVSSTLFYFKLQSRDLLQKKTKPCNYTLTSHLLAFDLDELHHLPSSSSSNSSKSPPSPTQADPRCVFYSKFQQIMHLLLDQCHVLRDQKSWPLTTPQPSNLPHCRPKEGRKTGAPAKRDTDGTAAQQQQFSKARNKFK